MKKDSKDSIDYAALSKLSPFELKDELMKLASGSADRLMLNAGRGNPNFLATIPRHGFFQLGLFSLREAERSFAYMPEGVGGFPRRVGIEDRFEIYVRENRDAPGIAFLNGAISYVRDQLGLDAGDVLYEFCCAILGLNYPIPPRMLVNSEKIVREFILHEMCGNDLRPHGRVDLFATEGGTAAMTYLFNSMRENKLLKPGDKIAIGTPIFTPYLEIPQLEDYQLEQIHIEADRNEEWQYPAREIAKLEDPAIKAFFIVNPSNPPSSKLNQASLELIGNFIETKRPDLILLTDDVYGTFADDFRSLFAVCPHNTILVYSFSKYFGATGWRLGVIATHAENVLDRMIANADGKTRKALHKRYNSITTTPDALPFIDRVVADSRTVALNHTAGLSTPQQVQMTLFALFQMMDEAKHYQAAMKRIIHRRMKALYSSLDVPAPENPVSTDYYHLLDLEVLSEEVYGRSFVEWILANKNPTEMLFRVARDECIVLLPGSGFGSRKPAARVSLANLNEPDYAAIGAAVRRVMNQYFDEFQADKRTKKGSTATRKKARK